MSIVTTDRDCLESDVVKFMETPLVKWVKTFKKSKEGLEFEELNDSVFLLDVLLTVDEGLDGEVLASINRSTSMDRDVKLSNWILLAKTIHRYYADYLQQMILSSWPDVFAITEDIDKGTCLKELQKFLVLILGYAVQCDRKENHIEAIKSFDVETQQALVMHIQQVTEVPRNVLSLSDENQLDPVLLSQSIQELCRERLQMIEKVTGFWAVDEDETADVANGRQPAKNSKCRQDAECRRHIKALDEELEEKSRLLKEIREELCAVNSELSKMKSENTILSAEAKTAKVYKDELDNMKEMVIQSEKYRKEVQKYKSAMAGVEFYKIRVDEIRKDNDLLLTSKAEVELQLTSSNKRIDSILDELVVSQKNLANSNSEKAELNKKLARLADENARLEYELSQVKGGLLVSNMSRFTSVTSIDCIPPVIESAGLSQTRGNSISDEMNETLARHLTRQQIENDELRMKLKESTDRHWDLERNLEQLQQEQEEDFQRKLEAVQQKLSQQSIRSSRELTKEFEQKVLEIEQRNIKLKQKVSKDFQQKLSEMEHQNQSLQQHIEELQKQIKFIEEQWHRDQQLCAKQHGEDLVSERRQLKRGITLKQDDCHDKISSQQTKTESVETEMNNLHGQSKQIYEMCDNSIGPSPQINRHSCQSSLSPELKDNQSMMAGSQSSTIDMDASYRSDRSFSSTTARDSTFSRAETPRCSSTIAASRGSEGRSRIQGIVTPVMRSTEKTPTDSGDPLRSTQKRQHPLDILRNVGSTFSRGDKHRHTLPVNMSLDRRHSQYNSPSSGHRGVAPPGSSHSRPPQMAPYGQHSHSVSEKRHNSSSSSRDYDDASLRSHLNSSIASEARESNHNRQRVRTGTTKNEDERETKWQSSSYYEKTVTRISECLALDDKDGRCRALVDEIMKLQAQNHQLSNRNADLQQSTLTTKAMDEKLSSLEDRNLELEKENRKLKQIIDSFIGGGPQSLYDKRTYQFNSSV